MNLSDGSIEGRLDIHLSPQGGDARIVSTRPLHAAQLFEGKAIGETLKLIPLLFNVCGQAQRIAAVRAIESAAGTPAGNAVEDARDRLKQIETLREHLWRVLLEWPEFYGRQQAGDTLATLIKILEAAKLAVDPRQRLCTRPGLADADTRHGVFDELTKALNEALTRTLFGSTPDKWAALDIDDLDIWVANTDTPAANLLRMVAQRGWQTLGRTRTDVLPDLDSGRLLERLDGDNADDFIATPSWDGITGETGPAARLQTHPLLGELANEFGHGLQLRLVARLLEIARLAGALRQASPDESRFSEAPGLSQLEAARGRLCHRVVLDGDRIARYRILAPTEWNFGPQGPAIAALREIHEDDAATARSQAKLLIHALDPCVGYNLEVEEDA